MAISSNDAVVNGIGLGLLAVGVVSMVVAWRNGSTYFHRVDSAADTVTAAVPTGADLR